MKTLKLILATLVAAVALWSCREDDELVLNQIKSSVLDPLPVKTFRLTEPANDQNPLLFTVTWTETQFILSTGTDPRPAAPVNYVLQLDKAGGDFSNPVTLTATNLLNANILAKDFNTLLLSKLNLEPGQDHNLQLRVVAYYGENQMHAAISENILEITVNPYKPLDVIPAVYIIGDMNGWNNTNTDFMMYRNSNDKNDHTYTYTGRLAANTYFKFLPEESLGTYKAYSYKADGEMVYEESAGGAFYNAVERYVTITIDTKALTYSITDYDASAAKTYSVIGPIGQFTNWDNEPAMTKSSYDPHQWSGIFDINIATALKFRGNRDWANNWGGKDSDIPYGIAVFDGPGATVSVPGKYKIVFNDLTGHYAIIQQ